MKSVLVIDTQELMDFIYNNDSINEKEALEKFIDSHRKQLEDKEYYKDIVDTLNSEQMHCEANELDDLLNTIYGNNK
jgi:hypothetical protein